MFFYTFNTKKRELPKEVPVLLCWVYKFTSYRPFLADPLAPVAFPQVCHKSSTLS